MWGIDLMDWWIVSGGARQLIVISRINRVFPQTMELVELRVWSGGCSLAAAGFEELVQPTIHAYNWREGRDCFMD
ncbi:hypothetical protein DsansV1_C18g0155331 [Dioscorea sansibarensis]